MRYSRNQIAAILSCAVYESKSTEVPPALTYDLEEEPIMSVAKRSRDTDKSFFGTGTNKVVVYVDRNHTELFVVFRGTEAAKMDNLLQDIQVRLLPRIFRDRQQREYNVLVHSGFIKASELVASSLDFVYIIQEFRNLQHITVCGHSLGGAMAILAVLSDPFADFLQHFDRSACHCVTVGSPRVGNETLNTLLNAVFATQTHFVNRGDPVAEAPSRSFGYVPLSQRTELDSCGFLFKSHACTKCYLRQLPAMS